MGIRVEDKVLRGIREDIKGISEGIRVGKGEY